MNKTMNSNTVRVGGTETNGIETIGHGVSQVGVGIILSMAALIGVWGAACLISGVAKSGSLMEMGRGYVTAVLGI